MEIKLEEKSLLELKAMAFDEMMNLEQVRRNLQLLHEEIQRRKAEEE